MTPRIILLAGYARSGKDTVANYLASEYGYVHFKFADPIYAALCAAFGVTPRYIENHKDECMPGSLKTWRYGLQTFGTEWGRDLIHENVWVTRALQRVRGHERVVFSDCRFMNEYHGFTDEDMQLWYVMRTAADPQTHHRSEQQIEMLKDQATVWLSNDADFGRLFEAVQEALT